MSASWTSASRYRIALSEEFQENMSDRASGVSKTFDGRVVLADYDPRWPELYEEEAARIRSLLETRALRIEHTGSTSVPALPAKPTVDMLLVVADTTDEAAYVPALEGGGYVLRVREPEWYQHRMFKGPLADVNLHVFSSGCPEIDRVLLFRDWLRASSADRELYARTKRELSRREWRTIDDYAVAKTAVVEEILTRASDWRTGAM
jgi:GrpB-like predicted nucleotidyltransferase (UPF0157 family)